MKAVFRILKREWTYGSKRMFDDSGSTRSSIQSADIGRSDIGDWIWNPNTSRACYSRCFFLSYIHLVSPSIYTHTQVGHQKPFLSISYSHFDEAPQLNESMVVTKSAECSNLTNIYSNIYPTRCNVTQFILSGNCSKCFGWYLHPSSGAQTHSNQFQLFHDSDRQQ